MLTELSLLAKQFCRDARVEATTEGFEDEDGHVRIYPPAGMREKEIEEIEGKVADRCVDILVEKGIFNIIPEITPTPTNPPSTTYQGAVFDVFRLSIKLAQN